MIKLTKKQKLEALTYAMFNILYSNGEFWKNPFICPAMTEYINSETKYSISYFGTILEIIPEFKAQKPDYVPIDFPWWPKDDDQSRFMAIERAIQLINSKP